MTQYCIFNFVRKYKIQFQVVSKSITVENLRYCYFPLWKNSRDVTSFTWHKKAGLYKRIEDGQHYHFHSGDTGDSLQCWWWEIILSGWKTWLTHTFLQYLLSLISLSLLSLQGSALRKLSQGTELSWTIPLITF